MSLLVTHKEVEVIFSHGLIAFANAVELFICTRSEFVNGFQTLPLLTESCSLDLPDGVAVVGVFALGADVATTTPCPVAATITDKVLGCRNLVAEVAFQCHSVASVHLVTIGTGYLFQTISVVKLLHSLVSECVHSEVKNV